MIDFALNLVCVLFSLGTVLMGAILMVMMLKNTFPHVCCDGRENGRFDITSIFCPHCTDQLLCLYSASQTRRYIAMGLLHFSGAYLLGLLVKAQYFNELSGLGMMIACFLCLLNKLLNYEYTRNYSTVETTMLVISGFAFFVVFSLYFSLTVNFKLLSLILCFFNMMISAIHRCVLCSPILRPGRRGKDLGLDLDREPYVYFVDKEEKPNANVGGQKIQSGGSRDQL